GQITFHFKSKSAARQRDLCSGHPGRHRSIKPHTMRHRRERPVPNSTECKVLVYDAACRPLNASVDVDVFEHGGFWELRFCTPGSGVNRGYLRRLDPFASAAPIDCCCRNRWRFEKVRTVHLYESQWVYFKST